MSAPTVVITIGEIVHYAIALLLVAIYIIVLACCWVNIKIKDFKKRRARE